MKKRLLTFFVVITLLVCSLLPLGVSAEATIENCDGGGFDFYSITVHYESPVVTQYEIVERNDDICLIYSENGKPAYVSGYVYAEPEETYQLRAGDSYGTRGTAPIAYKSAVTSQSGSSGNFRGLISGTELTNNMYYSTFPSQYGYIFNIQDGDQIQSVNPISILGVTEIVDDAGTPNPNIEFGEDGYAVDVDGGRIDANGYKIDENEQWYEVASDGTKRYMQLFRQVNGELVPISRYDENGKIIKVSQYSGAMIYKVDENGNVLKDSRGNDLRGTPLLGTPKMTTKVSKITVEVDALGTQLYDNPADDPQQKNTITVSVGDIEENIKNVPESGTVLGTAKSVTTRTEATFSRRADPTVQSVELELATDDFTKFIGNNRIYVGFHIETKQGEGAYNERYLIDNSSDGGMSLQNINFLTPDTSESTEENAESGGFVGFLNEYWLYIVICAAALILVIIIIIIVLVLTKKKDPAEVADAETNQESASKPEETVQQKQEEETSTEESSEEESSGKED